ncbi:hypothetical protein PIB30_048141 [Stylosanthes scabra]|uniref:Uncharacterized protein n=1 Tax=Stylosanthes scabra TaxID=79078 RepID=A0ABU6TIU5_9FABA|nr:hypothetical protein [Stylosanthes scabra]
MLHLPWWNYRTEDEGKAATLNRLEDREWRDNKISESGRGTTGREGRERLSRIFGVIQEATTKGRRRQHRKEADRLTGEDSFSLQERCLASFLNEDGSIKPGWVWLYCRLGRVGSVCYANPEP